MPKPPKGLGSIIQNRGGRFTPGPIKIPTNPHRRAEFERQQELLKAIHEQEKITWMKKYVNLR